MADTNEKILFKIVIDTVKAQQSIEDLKKTLKEQNKLFEGAKIGSNAYLDAEAKSKALKEEIKKLTDATKANTQSLGGVNQSAKFAAGSYDELRQKIKLAKEEQGKHTIGSADQKKATTDLNTLLKEEINLRKQNPSLFQERIKGALQENEALNRLSGGLSGAASQTKELGVQMLRLLMNPIVALIAAIAGALMAMGAAFKSTNEGGDLLEETMAAIAATMDVVRQRLAGMAQGLIALFSGDFTESANKFKEAFTGIGDAITTAAKAGIAYARAMDDLKERQTDFISQEAKSELIISRLLSLSRDRTKSERERMDALKEAMQLEKELSETKKGFAETEYNEALKLSASKNGINRLLLKDFIESDIAQSEALKKNNEKIRKWFDLSGQKGQEDLEKLFKAKLDAEKNYLDGTRRQQSQVTALQQGFIDERIAASDKLRELEIKNLESANQKIFSSIKERGEYELRKNKENTEKRLAENAFAFEKEKRTYAGQKDILDKLETAHQKEAGKITAEGEENKLEIIKKANAEIEKSENEQAAKIEKINKDQSDSAIAIAVGEKQKIVNATKKGTKERIDAEEQMALAGLDENLAIKLGKEQEYQNKVTEIHKTASDARAAIDEQDLQKKKERQDTVVSLAQKATDKIIAHDLQQSKIETDAKIKSLDKQLDAKTISQAKYDAERKKILTEQWEKERNASVIQAIINTAVSVTKLLWNPPLAWLAAGAGAIEVAAIAAAPIPEFAKGGLTGKKITASDGTKANRSNGDNLFATVKTGEVILNENQQQLLGGSRTFRNIGVPGFADGGRISDTWNDGGFMNRNATSPFIADDRFASMIGKELLRMPAPIVIVEDINTGQARVTRISERANI